MSIAQLQELLQASELPFTLQDKTLRVRVMGSYKRVYEIVFLPHPEEGHLNVRIDFPYPMQGVKLQKIKKLCVDLSSIAEDVVTIGWFPESKMFRVAAKLTVEEAIDDLKQMARTCDIISPLFDALSTGQEITPQLINLSFCEPTTYGWC